MPASSRNEVSEKHRTQRRVNSPYNQQGRKDKLAASRGWKPSIWKTLMFWKHDPSPPSSSSSDDEDSSSIESPENGNGESSRNSRRNRTNGTVEVQDDGGSADESNDALSVMNSSTVSEDQVLRQLISPIPRQNQNQNHQNQFQRPPATPLSSSFRRSSPYVAPLPPSSTLMQMQVGQQYKDPLATVSDYLDNVVLPRGGECTNVEALGLSMLIQSSVKGQASPSPTRETTPITRSPFVFPTANSPVPLKPTFTTPNTDFAAIFSRPDSSNPTTSFPNTSNTSTKPSSSTFASSSSTSTTTTTTTTARMLTRNPNGNVFFQGGGSAKPRYRSPAFGTSSSSRRKITFVGDSRAAESGSGSGSGGDGKRRRVGEESYLSVGQPSGPPPSTPLSSLSVVNENSAMDLDSHTQEGVNGDTIPNGVSNTTSVAAASQTTSLRFGTSSVRFMSTPARPSPLRQSMRADSSSPGSPGSIQDQNSNTPEGGKTNGTGHGSDHVAKAGQAKAFAIFAEIVSSASQPENDDDKISTSELVNPYDTRPPTKRARRPAKPARAPPPRPARRVVSSEVSTPPQPPSPKKLTALETIERSAPASVQTKRMHAETSVNGNGNGNISLDNKPSKRADREEREVIEIDDEMNDEDTIVQPPPKKVKPEKPKPTLAQAQVQTPTLVEVIDVDNDDIDMNEEVASAPVLRPSEVIEPVQDSERAMSTVPPPPSSSSRRSPSPSKSTITTSSTSRTLYPTSLGKGPGRFGTAPKEPSPLRNSFQPEEEKESATAAAASKSEETTSTSTSFFAMPKVSQAESKPVSSFFNTGFGSTTTTTTAVATADKDVDGPTSLFPKVPKPSESAVSSISSPFGVSNERSSFGKTSAASVFTVPIPEKPVEDTATTTTTGTNGFTFGQTSGASSTFGNKSFSFGAPVAPVGDSSKPTPTVPSALFATQSKVDDIEAIKRDTLSIKNSELPMFDMNVTTVFRSGMSDRDRDQSACAAALGVAELSLPTFKFDANVALKSEFDKPSSSLSSLSPFPASSSSAAPPPKAEIKGFDFAAAGMKAPVSAGWTCSVCFVTNKDTDSKCACCGEDKP